MSAVVQLASHVLKDADKEEMICYSMLPVVIESMSKDSGKRYGFVSFSLV